MKFTFFRTRNIPSVTNAEGIYKSNAMQYKLNYILNRVCSSSNNNNNNKYNRTFIAIII